MDDQLARAVALRQQRTDGMGFGRGEGNACTDDGVQEGPSGDTHHRSVDGFTATVTVARLSRSESVAHSSS